MFIKLLGASSLIGLSGLAVYFLVDSEPNRSTFTESKSGKYLEGYERYFVKAEDANNLSWWEWAFRNRWKIDFASENKPKKKFLDVVSGSGEGKSLRAICKDFYDKATTDVVSSDSSSEDKFFEQDVWRYCSILPYKPVNISGFSSETYESGKHGEKEKANLVSVKDEKNYFFWLEKDKELSLETGTISSRLFKDLKERNSEFYDVRGVCEEAYKKNSSDTSDITEAELFKYCSLKGEKSS